MVLFHCTLQSVEHGDNVLRQNYQISASGMFVYVCMYVCFCICMCAFVKGFPFWHLTTTFTFTKRRIENLIVDFFLCISSLMMCDMLKVSHNWVATACQLFSKGYFYLCSGVGQDFHDKFMCLLSKILIRP